jgi:two-component sensor histidine kinase
MTRKNTSKLPLGITVPQKTLDFVMRPKRVPHPGTQSLEAYLDKCRGHFLQMIVEALKEGALPERTRLVQCLAKEPHSVTDFSYRAVCHGKRSTCMELAAAFVHVTELFLRSNGSPSSHQRARADGDITFGNLILFSNSSHCSIKEHLPFPAHACFIELQAQEAIQISAETVKRYFPAEHHDQDMWLVDVAGCVHEHQQLATPSIVHCATRAKVGKAMPFPYPLADEKARAIAQNRTNELLSKILDDKQYLARVSVLATNCQIVISAPQVVFYDDAHEHGSVYDSGLTLLLEGSAPASAAELLQIYIVSRSLAQFLASVYGLVKEVARSESNHTVHMLSRALTHEVGNLGAILKRRLRLLPMEEKMRQDLHARVDIATKAARAISAHGDSRLVQVGNQFTELVQQYLKLDDFIFTFRNELAPEADIPTSLVFSLALNELLRNAYKHGDPKKTGNSAAECSIISTGKVITVHVSNDASPEDANFVRAALNDAPGNEDGLQRLLELVSLLRGGRLFCSPSKLDRLHLQLEFLIQ